MAMTVPCSTCTQGTKSPATQPNSIGFYINCFGHNSAKWKRLPMRLVPRENPTQDLYNLYLLDAAMERDPSDNVTE
jgi:hypothetical protein